MLVGGAVFLELQYLLMVGGSNASAARVLRCLVGGDDCDSTSESAEESDGAETAKFVRVLRNDAASGVASDAEEGAAGLASGAEIYVATGSGYAGVLPYLVPMAV